VYLLPPFLLLPLALGEGVRMLGLGTQFVHPLGVCRRGSLTICRDPLLDGRDLPGDPGDITGQSSGALPQRRRESSQLTNGPVTCHDMKVDR
jgi:hypothetical protein